MQKRCLPAACGVWAKLTLEHSSDPGAHHFERLQLFTREWRSTLLLIAVVTSAIIFNTSMVKQLPVVEAVILIFYILGLLAFIIPYLAMAPSRNTGHVALLDFYNEGDWPTVDLTILIGLLTLLGSMLGFDCAVHSQRRSGTRQTVFQNLSFGASWLILFWNM